MGAGGGKSIADKAARRDQLPIAGENWGCGGRPARASRAIGHIADHHHDRDAGEYGNNGEIRPPADPCLHKATEHRRTCLHQGGGDRASGDHLGSRCRTPDLAGQRATHNQTGTGANSLQDTGGDQDFDRWTGGAGEAGEATQRETAQHRSPAPEAVRQRPQHQHAEREGEQIRGEGELHLGDGCVQPMRDRRNRGDINRRGDQPQRR